MEADCSPLGSDAPIVGLPRQMVDFPVPGGRFGRPYPPATSLGEREAAGPAGPKPARTGRGDGGFEVGGVKAKGDEGGGLGVWGLGAFLDRARFH